MLILDDKEMKILKEFQSMDFSIKDINAPQNMRNDLDKSTKMQKNQERMQD